MSVVTISRQVGSLGDEIAGLVADKLGYALVSREGIHKLARECDAEFKDACSAFEEERGAGFWERLFYRDPAYTSLFEALNLELASKGDVVILGRGAQVALAELPGVFHARVVAPRTLRVQRVRERMGLSAEDANDFVHNYDKQRRALIESVYHKDLSDWSLYSMVLNTANLNAEAGAELIALAVQKMPPLAEADLVGQELARRAFAKRVESAIKKKVLTSPYRDITASSLVEGEIVLEGFVQDKVSKQKAGDIAARHPGVTAVDNRLRTTELSF